MVNISNRNQTVNLEYGSGCTLFGSFRLGTGFIPVPLFCVFHLYHTGLLSLLFYILNNHFVIFFECIGDWVYS